MTAPAARRGPRESLPFGIKGKVARELRREAGAEEAPLFRRSDRRASLPYGRRPAARGGGPSAIDD